MALVPTVTIYLLGDAGTGKKTFISRLPHAQHGGSAHSPSLSTVKGFCDAESLRVNLFNRPYTFHIYTFSRTSSLADMPAHILPPSMVILAFSVGSSQSFGSIQSEWHNAIAQYADDVPLMLIGLQRDLRNTLRIEDIILPAEGLSMAQKIGADRYAECSSATGELMWEVLEDVTRMGARTTTEKGGKSDDSGCKVM